MSKKIAIIGGGVAGLTAAYLLRDRFEITLFERTGRVGGNAFSLRTPDNQQVDIAAAIFGRRSYKNLFRLFKRLNIKTEPAFRVDRLPPSAVGAAFCDLDTGKSLFLTPGIRGLLSQRFALLKPDNLKSIIQFKRGLSKAQALLRQGDLKGLTVERALKLIPELTGDAKLIFISCLCLITSMHCDDVLDAPAAFFIEKMRAPL